MLVSDIVALYFWNVDQFIFIYTGYDIEDLDLSWCQFYSISQTLSLQCSAWLLVSE